jgi:hypothetical protein
LAAVRPAVSIHYPEAALDARNDGGDSNFIRAERETLRCRTAGENRDGILTAGNFSR